MSLARLDLYGRYANITVGHNSVSVLGPGPAWMCHELSPLCHYDVTIFLVKICENHYSPPCFPSPLFNPVYTPNQPIN